MCRGGGIDQIAVCNKMVREGFIEQSSKVIKALSLWIQGGDKVSMAGRKLTYAKKEIIPVWPGSTRFRTVVNDVIEQGQVIERSDLSKMLRRT